MHHIKSKTATKKHKNTRTSNSCHNSITNPKKRKLDCDTINTNNKKEPHKKKRKLNTLIESNKLLKKQNYELKQENNKLLKQRNHYKQAYRKLRSKLCQIVNDDINMDTSDSECECEIEIEIKNNNKSNEINENSDLTSPTPPPSKYFHKPRNKTKNNAPRMERNAYNVTHHNNGSKKSRNVNKPRSSINQSNIRSNNINKYDSIRARLLDMGYDKHQVINRISLYNGSGENAEFVFNQLINTFTSDTTDTDTSNVKLEQLLSNMTNTERIKRKKKNTDDHDKKTEFVPFKDSYYISVNCHVCRQHFDDMHKYKDHLQKHYDIDPTKTWKQCDFGCKHINLDNVWHFLRHISTHTNDNPYKCNITNDDIQCQVSKRMTSEMKQHWKSHFEVKEKNRKSRKNRRKRNILASQNESDYVAFEDSYHVSVDCHICKHHFNDFSKYAAHLETHYNNDPNKTWRKCDLGCEINSKKSVFGDNVAFMSHIAQQHTKQKPFQCDVVINGIKCKSLLCAKFRVREHWKKHWKKPTKLKKRKQIQGMDFESSYYVTVNCHICNQHFDDILEYKHHIKHHYDNNPLKTWLLCDIGCNTAIFSSAAAFVHHIASHTKQYPYKCNVVVNGIKCVSDAGSKGNLKQHWSCRHNFDENEESGSSASASASASDTSSSESDYSSSFSDNSHDQPETESDFNILNVQEIDFESGYYVAVNCHICKRYFDDFEEYLNHVKQHYDNDSNKKWLECDFGCKRDDGMPVLSSHYLNFMTHIAKHTKEKPFKCNAFVNGIKCTSSTTCKVNLRRHWELIHFRKESRESEHK